MKIDNGRPAVVAGTFPAARALTRAGALEGAAIAAGAGGVDLTGFFAGVFRGAFGAFGLGFGFSTRFFSDIAPNIVISRGG